MTLRRMSLVLSNFRQVVVLQNVAAQRSQSLSLEQGFNNIQSRSLSTTCLVLNRKQSTETLKTDLTNGGKIDSDVEAVPLAFNSFEDKSVKKEGAIKKSPLIIQHSLIGSKENWKTVAKEIHHVTKRAVYSVDARNHGDSPHTNVMSYATMAKDIELFVKQIGATQKISFLGHSFGGRIGLLLAMMRPDLIDKLVVVDSSPFVNKNSIKRWSLLREACALLKTIEPELKDCTGLTRRTLADKTIEHILTDKKDRALFLSNLITADEKSNGNGDKSRLWRVNLNAILNNPKLMSEYPDIFVAACECKDLMRYNGRVLFVSGDRSQFVRKDDETSIKALFPNAEFVWFADAGHWMHVERHAEFMKTVVPYLEASTD